MSALTARHEFRLEIPATRAAVEDFCMGFRCWAKSQRLPDRFVLELLTREAVTNAAAHACGYDSSKHVACILRLRPGRMIIAVYDQGPGFDWRAARRRNPDENACSGRGMEILRQYSHRVRFNRRGNAVIIIKLLTSEGTR